MPPEQLRASPDPTERVDQYALGVMLYESATGSLPFSARGPLALMNAILHDSIAPPSARNRLLPRAFDEVVLRAMSRDAEGRYARVDELAEALLPFAEPRIKARWASEFQAPDSIAVEPPRAVHPGRWARAAAVTVAAIALAASAVRSELYLEAYPARAVTERPSAPDPADVPPALVDAPPVVRVLPALPPPAATATLLEPVAPADSPAGEKADAPRAARRAFRASTPASAPAGADPGASVAARASGSPRNLPQTLAELQLH
jgi:hypothetical protein